jgi:proteasome lid subunit RPN8/RPN11
MLSESGLAAPDECCGLLLGREGAIEEARAARNVAADPHRRFEIDPQALIDAHRSARAGGAQVLGYYHSHPLGEATPSPTDQRMAARDGSVWVIVGQTAITFWRDGKEGFEPLSYTAEDR